MFLSFLGFAKSRGLVSSKDLKQNYFLCSVLNITDTNICPFHVVWGSIPLLFSSFFHGDCIFKQPVCEFKNCLD